MFFAEAIITGGSEAGGKTARSKLCFAKMIPPAKIFRIFGAVLATL